jgi:hypothetical protein
VKTHFIAVEEAITVWPESMKALCGAEILNPRPILDFDFMTATLTVASTLIMCRVCSALLMQPMTGVKKVYGLLPQEEAHRANLRARTDD